METVCSEAFTAIMLINPLPSVLSHSSYELGDYVVKVGGVKISPNPVVRGKPATFQISASTGKAISGGKLAIDVKYFGVHVHEETHDLCEEVSCPVASGNFVLSHTQTLPSFTPPGSYTLPLISE